ncbi:MAG TPA: hypothetical protein VFU43_25445 [Streptosporangiaceae bacterium]|nr:hypothetical protein [Streptosporangiaceae bacterium]
MSRSLPTQDPSRLGPFQLTGRQAETPAGIVYRGVDPHGRQISLAVLNQGAAADAAARDRFRAAILAEPLYTDPPAGTAAIVGAEPAGATPWVATLHEPGARGAERFLAAVLLEGRPRPATRRRGPLFQPHWLGSRDPALTPLGPRRDPGRERGIVTTIMMVAALLVLVALTLLLLFACQPMEPTPPPSPSPVSPTPSQSTQAPSPSPSPRSPTPSRTRSGSPSPSESGSADEAGPGGDA